MLNMQANKGQKYLSAQMVYKDSGVVYCVVGGKTVHRIKGTKNRETKRITLEGINIHQFVSAQLVATDIYK